jgi:hypothetical protein
MQIGQVPIAVRRCARHVHGIGQVPMPDGGGIAVFAKADTREALERRLTALLSDAAEVQALVARLPVLAYLLLGVSIVAPGERVEALTKDDRDFVRNRILSAMGGDLSGLAESANHLVRFGIVGGRSKHAEAVYAELVRQGLGAMLPVVEAQRALSAQGRGRA